MNEEAAQALSLQALAYLAADEHRLGALIAQCGWTLSDLRAGVNDPVVLAGVLDFLLGHEKWLIEFCNTADYPLDAPTRARRRLPGADQ